MSNSVLTISTLERVRLLSTNFEIIQPELGPTQMSIEMEHLLNFTKQSKEDGATFDFYIDTETSIKGTSKGDDPVELLKMNCRFRSDYNLIGEQPDYEHLEASISEFNSQIYPNVRAHIVNLLSLAGVSPNFLPYSMLLEENSDQETAE